MKTKKTWEKVLGIFLAAVLVLGMIPLGMWMTREKESHAGIPLEGLEDVYFRPSSEWIADNRTFAMKIENN